MSKSQHDASNTIKGFLYQFYQAILFCFDLQENESLIIEKFGDISIDGNVNVEVKHVQRNLTDNDQNIWKTLKNWTDINTENYKNLLLLTTQPIGPHVMHPF